MNLTVIDHPLVAHKLSLMREADCSTYSFRTLTRELARLMAYEAGRELPSEEYVLQGWCGEVTGRRLGGLPLHFRNCPTMAHRRSLGIRHGRHQYRPNQQ